MMRRSTRPPTLHGCVNGLSLHRAAGSRQDLHNRRQDPSPPICRPRNGGLDRRGACSSGTAKALDCLGSTRLPHRFEQIIEESSIHEGLTSVAAGACSRGQRPMVKMASHRGVASQALRGLGVWPKAKCGALWALWKTRLCGYSEEKGSWTPFASCTITLPALARASSHLTSQA